MAHRTKPHRGSTPETGITKRGENSEIRKLRNRISQKAFRARRAMRIQELEERLHNDTYSDAECVKHLQNQNSALREQLLECHKKLTSLQVSMRTLAHAAALTLGIDSLDGTNEIESTSQRLCTRCKQAEIGEDEGCPAQGPPTPSDHATHLVEAPSSNNGDGHDGELGNQDCQAFEQEPQTLPTSATEASNRPWTDSFDRSTLHPELNLSQDYIQPVDCPEQSQLLDENLHTALKDRYSPGSLSLGLFLSEDLGPLKYKNILMAAPSVISPSVSLRRTNSHFSDHIDALEQCVCLGWSRWRPFAAREQQLANPIQSILLTFVSMSWQSMTAWHTYTKAHVPLKNLMAWRICRTPDRYLKITPTYQPTKLQMSVPHPSIIDWIPWPQLRDKLILRHSGNPCLDSLICDIGNSYVVPADLSLLIKCPQSVLGYVGVWDLVRSMAPEATGSPEPSPEVEGQDWRPTSYGAFSPNTEPCIVSINATNPSTIGLENLSLPAKDSEALFSSRILALQAFKILEMDQGASNFRLDPAFFGRHPELYDPSCDLMAQGVALRPKHQLAISAPRELDTSIVGQYQEMSRYLIDLALESRHMDS